MNHRKLFVAVAARNGLWSNAEETPFGHGRPWSRSQLEAVLRAADLEPSGWTRALYAPPFNWTARWAEGFEQVGAGDRIIEADDRLAGLHALAVLEVDADDAAADLGPHHHRLVGAQGADRGQAGLQGFGLHGDGLDRGRRHLAARAAGAVQLFVSDPNATRLAIAKEIIPDVVTINPREQNVGDVIRTATEGGVGCDVALECVGNEKALQACLDAVRKQGTIVQVGLHPGNSGLNWHNVTFKDVDIRGSWAYPTHYWPRVISLIGLVSMTTGYVLATQLEVGMSEVSYLAHIAPIGIGSSAVSSACALRSCWI